MELHPGISRNARTQGGDDVQAVVHLVPRAESSILGMVGEERSPAIVGAIFNVSPGVNDPTDAMIAAGPNHLVITVNGLIEIGFQLFSRKIGPLPDGCVLSAEVADEISRRVSELNATNAPMLKFP